MVPRYRPLFLLLMARGCFMGFGFSGDEVGLGRAGDPPPRFGFSLYQFPLNCAPRTTPEAKPRVLQVSGKNTKCQERSVGEEGHPGHLQRTAIDLRGSMFRCIQLTRHLRTAAAFGAIPTSALLSAATMRQAVLPAYVRGATPPRARSLSTRPDMEELEAEFAEARELLSDAEEAMGTTYFNDDLEDAKEATEKVLDRYERMKESMPEGSAERLELQRSVGLKIEELRGRYTILVQSLIDDD